MAYRLSEMESDTYQYNRIHANKLTFSGGLNFFKTTASVSTAYDLVVRKDETRDRGRDRFSPMNLSFSTSPFEFLSISESHTYIIETGQSSVNTLSMTLRAPAFRLPYIERISGLSFSVGWSHNYMNIRSNRLTIGLGFNMQISELWSITLSMSSANKELYLYSADSAAEFNQEKRSFFKDLLYSFMIWDTDKLKETRFNMQSLNLTLLRDLHNWELRFNTSMSQRVNTIGRKFTYFDLNFVLSISMKMNIGLTFPEQRYRYTADERGEYYGKFN
jgi:hypothetical protein